MDEIRNNNQDEKLRLDLTHLSEEELEELARLIIRKLRVLMQQERDRTGRF